MEDREIVELLTRGEQRGLEAERQKLLQDAGV